jgi:hypothetical protein
MPLSTDRRATETSSASAMTTYALGTRGKVACRDPRRVSDAVRADRSSVTWIGVLPGTIHPRHVIYKTSKSETAAMRIHEVSSP